MICFDHNATTPLHPRVRASMMELLERGDLGNPSSIHGLGRQAREVVEQARRRLARSVEAQPLEVTFTSGGTEADALAVLGVARSLRQRGLPHGVLSSPLEHPAVQTNLDALAQEGHVVVRLAVDDAGRIDLDALKTTLVAHPEIGLVTLAACNHELGNAYDIAGAVEVVRAVNPEILVHTDAVQAFGKIPLSFEAWGVDLLSVSSHKIYGPAGAGALIHRKALRLASLWNGGQQERGRRPGTESLLAIHGFGVAAAEAAAAIERRRQHCNGLRERLVAGLLALDARIHGDPRHHAGNTVSAGFPGCDAHMLTMALDLAGFAASTGSACSAGTTEPSPILLALGHDRVRAQETVRFSLGRDNTLEHVEALLAALTELLPRVRAASNEGSFS